MMQLNILPKKYPVRKFIGFETGGHLLIGHEEEVRSEVAQFIKVHLIAGERT